MTPEQFNALYASRAAKLPAAVRRGTRNVGTTAGTVAAGDDARLSDARTPLAHTHQSTDISESTATGRAVLTAADAATARTAIDAPSSAQLAGVQATAEAALPKAGGTLTGTLDEQGMPVYETVETTPAVTRTIPADDAYSLRYDELSRLIAGAMIADRDAMIAQQDALEARIEALEGVA